MTPLETLTTLRATYSTPMADDQIGALLNAVAWTHRLEGYGLLRKPDGAHCRQPGTGILVSRDILMLPDGRIFDCLIDAEGKATPAWGAKTPLDPARWVAPLAPAGATAEPPPTGGGPVPQDYPHAYPGDALGAVIGDRLFADYAAAGQGPDPGMAIWIWRTCWDMANPPYLTPEQSLAKHQAEWQQILGRS